MANGVITPPNPEVLTGNDCLVKLAGRTVGFATNIQVNIHNNMQPIKSIGKRKPIGLKSLDWSGTASMTLHILVKPEDGVVTINTHDDDRADDLYVILILHKNTGARIGQLIGGVQDESFSISNNQFSSRDVGFELMDWEPMEAYN